MHWTRHKETYRDYRDWVRDRFKGIDFLVSYVLEQSEFDESAPIHWSQVEYDPDPNSVCDDEEGAVDEDVITYLPEVLEWWDCSADIIDALYEEGEVVIRVPYTGYWWGRTSSGTAVYADSLVEHLYEKYILRGKTEIEE